MEISTDTNSERLYLTDVGKGVPIIFIHGNLSTGLDTFSPQLEYFSPSFRCLCPDLRCHGKSFSKDTFWTPKNQSEDIIRMMDQLCVNKAHFVGHSMGGDIILYILLNHKERVLTATSICSGGYTNNSIISYLGRFDPDKLDPVIHGDFIERIKKDHGIANQGDWKRFLKHTVWNSINFPGFTDDELKCMDRPFLLLRGKKDRLVKDHEVARLRASMPDFHLIEIDGGHALTTDEKTVSIVNNYIHDFIEGRLFSPASHDGSGKDSQQD